MRVTVLGCSGSVGGPNSPTSGYLLTAPGVEPTVIDFGPGVLGALQRYADPSRVNVMLSHLHADHCLDVPGLLVWRRYHPIPAVGRARVYGPADTAFRLGVASAECAGTIDDVTDTLDLRRLHDGDLIDFGAYTVLTRQVFHPPETYGMRVTSTEGRVLAYTADTGMCDAVVDLARDADYLLCEASWTHADNRPPGIHLSGVEAGQLAKMANAKALLLTHIPPWTSREAIVAEAAGQFDGPVHAVSPGEVFEV